MAKSEVSLVLRVRLNGKRHHYAACFTARGAIKPHVGLVQGREQPLPGATYYLRYRQNGKRVWEAVGADPAQAVTARLKRAHALEGASTGREGTEPASAGGSAPATAASASQPALSLQDAINRYIDFVPRKLSDRTTIVGADQYTPGAMKAARAYRFRLEEFAACCGVRLLREVTVDHVTEYILSLRAGRLSPKTLINRLTVLRSFLRWSKMNYHIVSEAVSLMELRVPRHAPKVYSTGDLTRLFAVSSARDARIWRLFLATGLRDAEMAYLAWDDIDFERRLIHLREKPDAGFRLKDREERQVPLPDGVLNDLRHLQAKRRAGQRWVLPTVYGRPDLHFLRRLKRVAWRGNLNCGHCISQPSGASCKDRPCCKRWQLHSFRRTCATFWTRGGIDPRTVQAWLGHSDLQTTLRYLSAESLNEPSVRARVNGAFAGFGSAAEAA